MRVPWFKLEVGISILPTKSTPTPLPSPTCGPPKDVSNITSGACECVSLHDRRCFAGQGEMGTLPWFIQVDPTSPQESSKVDKRNRRSESRCYRRMARKSAMQLALKTQEGERKPKPKGRLWKSERSRQWSLRWNFQKRMQPCRYPILAP